MPYWGVKGRRWIILSETSRKGLFGKQEGRTCWGARSPDGQVSLAELKAVQSRIMEHWDIREDPRVHSQADHGERESG